MMKKIAVRHKACWIEKGFFKSVLLGVVLLLLSVIFNHFASEYATSRASGPVSDLLLDNLPVVNVDFVVNEGAVLFGYFIVAVIFLRPKRIPFVIKSIALFVLIRAIFITFTHLGPIPEHSYIDTTEMFSGLATGGDYFFSGHTGMPFLMALFFWQDRRLRFSFLAISVLFAVSVILGHLHYSIDVFAAFFITYTIYVMAKRFFRRDYSLFLSALEDPA
jgi:membrane-associated phospholipid phosphatase